MKPVPQYSASRMIADIHKKECPGSAKKMALERLEIMKRDCVHCLCKTAGRILTIIYTSNNNLANNKLD